MTDQYTNLFAILEVIQLVEVVFLVKHQIRTFSVLLRMAPLVRTPVQKDTM